MQEPYTDYELSILYPHLTQDQRWEMESFHRGWIHNLFCGVSTPEEYELATPPYPEHPPDGFPIPEYNPCLDINNEVEKRYSSSLTEEYIQELSCVSKRLIEDSELKKYLKEDHQEEDKKKFFMGKFNELMFDYFDKKFDFYIKIREEHIQYFLFEKILEIIGDEKLI